MHAELKPTVFPPTLFTTYFQPSTMARTKQTARQTTGLNAAHDRSLVAKTNELVSQVQSLSNELAH